MARLSSRLLLPHSSGSFLLCEAPIPLAPWFPCQPPAHGGLPPCSSFTTPPSRNVQLAEKREAELKNGRLAMIGIASVVSAMSVPGSVPLLENAPQLTGVPFALPFGTF